MIFGFFFVFNIEVLIKIDGFDIWDILIIDIKKSSFDIIIIDVVVGNFFFEFIGLGYELIS